MATAAQPVQAVVVIAAVAFGFFTSMNQALIGTMTGAAAARGQNTVHPSALYGVMCGWIMGPERPASSGYGISALIAVGADTHTLVAST